MRYAGGDRTPEANVLKRRWATGAPIPEDINGRAAGRYRAALHVGAAKLEGAQFPGRRLAVLSIGNDLKKELLPLVESMQSCTFHGADMHEHIAAAVIGLDESIALSAIEPLHSSLQHIQAFFQQPAFGAPVAAHGGTEEFRLQVFLS